MVDVTPADPNVSGSADNDPDEGYNSTITRLPQRLGADIVAGSVQTMPPAYPVDVNAPDIDYHVPTTSAGSNTPTWGGEGGPSGSFVPVEFGDDGYTLSPPVQGGQESQTRASALTPPVQANATTATTGGTLAAATYYYVVTALDDEGESLKSNEKSVVTTGSTSENTISWTDGDDADDNTGGATGGYNVYVGTAAGTEDHLLAHVAQGTFTVADTGTRVKAATPPTTDTSFVAPGMFTRTNIANPLGGLGGANRYPNDVNAPAITKANAPSSSFTNDTDFGGEDEPGTNGEQDDLGG